MARIQHPSRQKQELATGVRKNLISWIAWFDNDAKLAFINSDFENAQMVLEQIKMSYKELSRFMAEVRTKCLATYQAEKPEEWEFFCDEEIAFKSTIEFCELIQSIRKDAEAMNIKLRQFSKRKIHRIANTLNQLAKRLQAKEMVEVLIFKNRETYKLI